VVLVVWATFGFVLFQAFGISRGGAKSERLSAGGRSVYDRRRR
jgi:hypothetical protein